MAFWRWPTCLRSHIDSSDVVLAPAAAEYPVRHWQIPAEGWGFQVDAPSLHPHLLRQSQNQRPQISFVCGPPHPPHHCCWIGYCSAHGPRLRHHHQSRISSFDVASFSSFLSSSSFPAVRALFVKTAHRAKTHSKRDQIYSGYITRAWMFIS